MVDSYIELGAYDCAKLTEDNLVLCSIAMSLKRIADALHSDKEGIGIGTYLSEISDYVIDLKKPSV